MSKFYLTLDFDANTLSLGFIWSGQDVKTEFFPLSDGIKAMAKLKKTNKEKIKIVQALRELEFLYIKESGLVGKIPPSRS